MATSGDHYLATSGDFFMAMGTLVANPRAEGESGDLVGSRYTSVTVLVDVALQQRESLFPLIGAGIPTPRRQSLQLLLALRGQRLLHVLAALPGHPVTQRHTIKGQSLGNTRIAVLLKVVAQRCDRVVPLSL